MSNRQLLKDWIALSVLFHLTVLVLASLIPLSSLRPPDVMVVDLADLPRSIDFPRPQPGIVEGAPPQPAAPAPPRGGAAPPPRPPPPGAFRAAFPRRAQVPPGDHPLSGKNGHGESGPRGGTGRGDVIRKRGGNGGESRRERADHRGEGRGPPHRSERPGDPVHLLLRRHQAEDRTRLAVSAGSRGRGAPGRLDHRFRHRAERKTGVRGASAGVRTQGPGRRGARLHPQGVALQPDSRPVPDPQPENPGPLHLRDALPPDPVGAPGYSSDGKSRSYSSPLRRTPTSAGSDGRMASSHPPSNGSAVIVSGDPSTTGLTSTTTPETGATTSQTATA